MKLSIYCKTLSVWAWRGIRLVVLPLIAVLLPVCVLLYLIQDQLVYIPYPTVERTPQSVGLAFEPIRFPTSDGLQLQGWFVPQEKAEFTVLFFHGNAGNISHRIDTLKLLHSIGLQTFIFDYRGYGESQGTPSEQGTYLDAQAAWQYLIKSKALSPNRIILFGRSLGGAVAAALAGETRPAGIILESTFTSLPDLAQDLYPILPARWLTRFEYNTLSHMKNFQSPVLIIHSIEDDIVPFTHGQRLYDNATGTKQFLQIQGDHNRGYRQSVLRYQSGIKQFLSALSDARPNH